MTNNVHDHDWWRGAVIYQIYPRSFADANGDGIGDLQGVISKLSYIARLGVDAIWLSPFFPSPMKDFGYDVKEYCDVDPMFGTLADFRELVDKAHQSGLKVLIDLVLSHTSDQHPWFLESKSSRENPRADWYVWADPKPDGTPPNNWLSIFGGSAWQWHGGRRQYYLHNFLTSQPDLNFHNPQVRQAMLEVARFWLEIGVDGFRLDTVNMYTHDAELRDNPPATAETRVNGIPAENPYGMQATIYNINRPENLQFIAALRALTDQYGATTTVGELGAVANVGEAMAEYTASGRLHMAYSFGLLNEEHSPAYIRAQVEQIRADSWGNWALSNHDVTRVVSRWGVENFPAAAPTFIALATTLRGSSCLYQGEELGLPEAEVPFEALQDPYGIEFWPEYKGRDGCRTPMTWENAPDHGFGSEHSWLPHDPRHLAFAADEQEKDPESVLNRVRRFLHFRRHNAILRRGKQHFLTTQGNDNLLFFARSLGEENIACLFNLSAAPQSFTTTGKRLQIPGFETVSQQHADTITIEPWGVAFLTFEEEKTA